MTAFLALRSGNSGPEFVGTNHLDVVLWDATLRKWFVGSIGGGGGVTSVFGRPGPAIVAQTGDYDSDQIDNLSTVPGASVSDALDDVLALATVAGTPQIGYVIGWDGTQKIWGPVPTAFAINSFATTGATLVLAGATVVNPGFTASYNQAAAAVTLTDSVGHSDPISLPGTAFISPHSFPLAAYGSAVTFTDTASSPLGSAARNVTITAGQLVYFGSAVDPGGGGYTDAFLKSFGSVLKLAPAGTYAYNASALQSCFFGVRAAAGVTPSNLTVNGFPFACSVVATISDTNANGVVENYTLIRSDNVGLGSFNLVEA